MYSLCADARLLYVMKSRRTVGLWWAGDDTDPGVRPAWGVERSGASCSHTATNITHSPAGTYQLKVF